MTPDYSELATTLYVMLLTGAVCVVGGGLFWVAARKRTRRLDDDTRCIHCKYVLHEYVVVFPIICPECGVNQADLEQAAPDLIGGLYRFLGTSMIVVGAFPFMIAVTLVIGILFGGL